MRRRGVAQADGSIFDVDARSVRQRQERRRVVRAKRRGGATGLRRRAAKRFPTRHRSRLCRCARRRRLPVTRPSSSAGPRGVPPSAAAVRPVAMRQSAPTLVTARDLRLRRRHGLSLLRRIPWRGFALAGAGTGWGLAQGLGSGRSDAFQAGVYGGTRLGPVYVGARSRSQTTGCRPGASRGR